MAQIKIIGYSFTVPFRARVIEEINDSVIIQYWYDSMVCRLIPNFIISLIFKCKIPWLISFWEWYVKKYLLMSKYHQIYGWFCIQTYEFIVIFGGMLLYFFPYHSHTFINGKGVIIIKAYSARNFTFKKMMVQQG